MVKYLKEIIMHLMIIGVSAFAFISLLSFSKWYFTILAYLFLLLGVFNLLMMLSRLFNPTMWDTVTITNNIVKEYKKNKPEVQNNAVQ